MADQNTHYVYNGIEVKLTGRTAAKNISKVSRRTQQTSTLQQLLHEITPVNSEEGSWKKWVDLTELFIINEKK